MVSQKYGVLRIIAYMRPPKTDAYDSFSNRLFYSSDIRLSCFEIFVKWPAKRVLTSLTSYIVNLFKILSMYSWYNPNNLFLLYLSVLNPKIFFRRTKILHWIFTRHSPLQLCDITHMLELVTNMPFTYKSKIMYEFIFINF